MRLIGVLGGTFDPVHIGHVRLAIELQEKLGFDHTRLIPNSTPNHRDKAQCSDELRLAMLAEVTHSSALRVDERELQRGGISYMVDTLGSLRSDFPADALCMVVGLDAYLALPEWHRWQTLFDLAHVVVATRPQTVIEPDASLATVAQDRIVSNREQLNTEQHGKILFVDIPQLEISSTDIRRRRQLGLDITYLVPDGVKEIIEKNHLYLS